MQSGYKEINENALTALKNEDFNKAQRKHQPVRPEVFADKSGALVRGNVCEQIETVVQTVSAEMTAGERCAYAAGVVERAERGSVVRPACALKRAWVKPVLSPGSRH